MASLLEQLKAGARIAVYLTVAFILIQLWQDPAGAGQATVDGVRGIGHLFAAIIDKIGQFVNGLTK